MRFTKNGLIFTARMHQNSWNPSKHYQQPSYGARTTGILKNWC